LVRTLSPPEPYHRARDAKLVRRVLVPCSATVAAVDEHPPIPLERGGKLRRCRVERARAGGKGNRGGRRIEITELRSARHIGDSVRGGRLAQRALEIVAKLLGRRAPSERLVARSSRAGDRDGGGEAFRRPEVVPVRVHRLGRITLVTD